MSRNKDKFSITRLCTDIGLLIYFAFCWYLYFKQLSYYETGLFESDTVVHVKFAVVDGYYHTLAAFIYKFLYLLPWPNLTISFVLAAVTALSIVATIALMKRLLVAEDTDDDKQEEKQKGFPYADSLIFAIAIFANFVMGFYIREANRQHYIGYQNANMWHNSTYIFMRLFAILTMIVFFGCYKEYKSEEGLKLKSWLLLTVLLAITTGFKASFLTVFAPVLFILLVSGLFEKQRISQLVFMGLSVVPSLGIMALQNSVMSSENTGFGIAFFKTLSMRGDHPKATVILSILFPLSVFVYHIKDFYKDRIYSGSLLMWLIAFLEVLFLVETGDRELDSNFMWGYSIALFFLFVTSIIRLLRDWYSSDSIIKKPKYMWLCFETVILTWHVVSGLWYFILLLSGVTYFV